MRPDDPLERLRAANPAREVPRDAVDHSQVLARARDTPDGQARSRRRRAGWPTALVAVVLVLAGAGGALAASGVGLPWLSDDTPIRGTISSSVRVLPLRVADPTGGAPWALRAYRTARGWACLEIGRVIDGRFDRAGGVVGCSGPSPQRPAPASHSGTSEGIITLDGSPVATRRDGGPADRAGLRTVAYGVPDGLDSAYLVVLPGDVPSHRLRAIEPCERQNGRLVAAVAGRCPVG